MRKLNLSSCLFYPQDDRVLIKVVDPDEDPDSVIVMTKKESTDYPQFGEVIRMGPNVLQPTHAVEASKISVGCLVTFSRHSALSGQVKLENGDVTFLLKQSEIQSVVVPDGKEAN